MKKRFEYKILDVKYNVWTGKFNEDEIVKPKLRIRNLLRKKMSSNLNPDGYRDNFLSSLYKKYICGKNFPCFSKFIDLFSLMTNEVH